MNESEHPAGGGIGVMPGPANVYGVDFSGAADADRRVWMAQGRVAHGRLSVERCAPAREWFGATGRDGTLASLVEFVKGNRDAAFGLDFPFGLPAALVPESTWERWVRAFGARYPDLATFDASCHVATDGRELKRATDREQGTPFSPYNIRVMYQTYYGIRDVLAPLAAGGKPQVLPMQGPPLSDRAWVLEICPSSTLQAAGLPHTGYKRGNGRDRERLDRQKDTRHYVLRGLEAQADLLVWPGVRQRALEDPGGDALDSLLAALATFRASTTPGRLEPAAGSWHPLEGHVYV